MNAEQRRLMTSDAGRHLWRLWGPYLSERQWATVREDYSPGGDAWEYFPFDLARSRAYRWGEDGLAGFSDDRQRICLALACWNGRDPILKERLFGLSNPEGNHGEDVKELYYYLDAIPTHAYLKMLYKYPQAEFPYARLRDENRRRGKDQPEFELIDTGVFDGGRYFDIVVEYAKRAPDDILMRIDIHNRGPENARLHVLPQIWFRNTWSWTEAAAKPKLILENGHVALEHAGLGRYALFADGAPEWLFCGNETNVKRLWGQKAEGFFKDAFHDYVIHRRLDAVNPRREGTKAAACYAVSISGGGKARLRLRLRLASDSADAPFEGFDRHVEARRREADAFYADLQRGIRDPDRRRIQRQAFAGMIWSKQFYRFDVRTWLEGDPAQPPPPPNRHTIRNSRWQHLNNAEVLSMPDTWEYPWYAAWDLAFHCIPLALIDPEFAKNQLLLLNRVWYMHPNGQLPAYEWDFGQANPPVHAWAAWRVYQIDRKQRGGQGDLAFLERILHKLTINFTWWVNRTDKHGRNVFQGGFLGLDNIGVFDRSRPLPMGGHIDQADGTSWMAMYCLNLMRIALELALDNPVYEDLATKFFEHFLYVAKAMTNIADCGLGLWDERDEFYYDALRLPGGQVEHMRLRSMVGLIPLFAVETLEPELLDRLPAFRRRLEWFLSHRPEMARLVSRWEEPGRGERRLLSLLRGHRMKRLLNRMLDPEEFLSDHGVRSLSRRYGRHPYELPCGGPDGITQDRHRTRLLHCMLDPGEFMAQFGAGALSRNNNAVAAPLCESQTLRVAYEPGESGSGLFGGNSNWRGPVWFPVNYLIIESLQKFHHYYGDDFTIECPVGSKRFVTLLDAANELTERLTGLFAKDASGRRPVFGDADLLQADPHFRDHILFYEYFHGENGQGLGASHQTGWTGLIAKLLQPKQNPV